MIFCDDDSVKIGGVILPGIYKSIEINHEAQIDEQKVEGSSRVPKQATGYEDAKVVIEIQLIDSEHMTKEEKLQIIQNLFKNMSQSKPIVHELISTHSSIRGVDKVIIKNMGSKENNKKNEIIVSLELLQYDVMTIQASSGKKSEGSSSSNLSEEYTEYLSDDRGKTPKKTNKTSKTPAVDNSRVRRRGIQE